MKRIIKNLIEVRRAGSTAQRQAGCLTLLLFALAVATPLVARAQVVGFGGGVTITGTTNTGAIDTNVFAARIRNNTFTITAPGATTVTGFVGNVYLTLNPNSITNALLVGTWSGTNFTSTNVAVASFYSNAPVYTVFQAQTGTNSPSVQEIYGP